MTNPDRTGSPPLLAALLFVLLAIPSSAQVIDDFDEDPVDNEDREFYEPGGAGVYSTDDGYFRVTIPTGVNLDTWTGVDNGIQIRRTDFPENFAIETRIRILGSGDPNDPIFPPIAENDIANLLVNFSQFDLYHWGPQRGTNLVNQRVGNPFPPCNEFNDLDEISLQILRAGTSYTFSWRASDDDPWLFLCESQTVEEPQSVGLIFKTWQNLTTEQTFEFEYFRIFEPELEGPSITVCESGLNDEDADAEAGTITYRLRATNSEGSAEVDGEVDVEVYVEHAGDEPQTGIVYSIVDVDGESWWRMEVPQLSDLGAPFDVWTTVDNAPQLRLPIEEEIFVAETRVRIDPTIPPPAADEFLAGLCLVYGDFDVLHWNVGQERRQGFSCRNLFLERTAQNNLAPAVSEGLLEGVAVDLRLERTCHQVRAYFRTTTPDDSGEWILVGGGPPVIDDDPKFLRGDADASGGLTLTDAVNILNFLFLGAATPPCLDAADSDDDGQIALTDAVRVLGFLFLGFLFLGNAPPAPPGHEICGKDVNQENPDLGCESFSPCD